MGDSSWAIEASISRLENATHSEAHPAPHGCRHPVGTTDSEIALQQLRRAVLGSRCGSRRYRRRCVTFDTEPVNGEDCSGEGGQRKERRRETVLGTRHGTPLRRGLDFHSHCESFAINDLPPSSSSSPKRADVDRTTIQQRRQFRPCLLLSVDVNSPMWNSKQLAACSQEPWTPSPAQSLDEHPSDNTPLIRRRSPIAAAPGAASNTAKSGRISKQLAAAAAPASPSSPSPHGPSCTAVAATAAAAGTAAASISSPRRQVHEQQQYHHSDQASSWPYGPSSGGGGSRQSRSARLKLLLQRSWEDADPESHLYYSPSGRRTSPSPSSSPRSWPSPATCPGRKATCTAEPFRNSSIS